ncbi:hypothetical protein C8R47DRAFT_1137550 [Mycena vitilis]|nr:hypothetical protein C8R47DRAFT_1137550 [Mycena vitilis]
MADPAPHHPLAPYFTSTYRGFGAISMSSLGILPKEMHLCLCHGASIQLTLARLEVSKGCKCSFGIRSRLGQGTAYLELVWCFDAAIPRSMFNSMATLNRARIPYRCIPPAHEGFIRSSGTYIDYISLDNRNAYVLNKGRGSRHTVQIRTFPILGPADSLSSILTRPFRLRSNCSGNSRSASSEPKSVREHCPYHGIKHCCYMECV